MASMTGNIVVIFTILSFLAVQGGIIFVTACLLRKAIRSRLTLSKPRAILLSYCFWIVFMLASVLLDGEFGFFDGGGTVLFACLTGLASATIYLRVWQRHEIRSTRNIL